MLRALSVLDQSPVPHGSSAADAVAATLRLAEAAERLGYRRYWLAEHHNTASLAGSAPEILVAAVAGRTVSMRVGSGGVLLPYYSPLKVAETFRVLHTLFPGRIDLGLGRAAGTDPAAEQALRPEPAADEQQFASAVADVVAFLHGSPEQGHPAAVRAVPEGPGGPEVWLLGSSSFGSACAAYLGLSFCFAHFITPDYGPQIVAAYRRGFRPSPTLAEPRASVAVAVMCAESRADAERLASTADLWRLGPEGSDRGPILAPAEVAARSFTELERARMAQQRAKVVVGDPGQVGDRLAAIADEFDADELVLVTVCHDEEARLRSYELVADAVGLGR